MKKKKLKELRLNKQSVSNLQLKQITGGGAPPKSMISCPGGVCDPPRPNTNV